MPLEYWETCDARQGGVIVDVNECGICVLSFVDMSIGGELRISVFFSLGREFDGFQALTRIIGKDLCCQEGWESYEYKLTLFVIKTSISGKGPLPLIMTSPGLALFSAASTASRMVE